MRRVLIAVVVLLVIAVGAAAFGLHWIEGADLPGLTEDQVFELPKGASSPKLPKLFEEAKLIRDPLRVKLYLKLHPAPLIKAGRHPLEAKMTLGQVLARLADNPLPDDFPVKILEGWRLRDIDAELSSANPPLFQPGDYLKAATDVTRFKIPFKLGTPSLEGYVYPETYMMPTGRFEVDKLIQRQIDSFAEKFATPYAEEIEKSGHSLSELVTVASLLEREEPKPENRPKVAGIIYKRLEKSIPLGVDATSRYTLKDWSDRLKFLERLRDKTDPYNSREKLGLPPSPIGAPSLPSLLAALRPEKTPYLYYLHDKDGNVHFGRDNAEHEANRKKYNVY